MGNLLAEHWQRVQQLLDAALHLPPDEAAAFLAAECQGDDALRREAEALLQACRRADDFLDRPPAALLAELVDDTLSDADQRIGPYRITGEAGRGGMGVVYSAERADGQFQHRVALKLLPWELKREQVIGRFLEERQILASLNHPAIARLLDGGVTASGLPWFAMEFVDGTPIDQYCSTQDLSIERRLSLFIDICSAVQYAHQSLVVHRDLKPSNILVTRDGAIKLLDFGIAKMLPREGESDDGKRTVMRWLTPQYASPEQLRGEAITTVSDVYSLGVLLYELLSGVRPFAAASASSAELERAICEQEPERPSAAAVKGESFAGLTPEKLSRRLRGDLDMIVSMALRKEPARRYSSAALLAEDVERHLAGLPVQARPPALAYRASRFVRRHRAGVVAAAALMLSLLAGLFGTVRQGRMAARERDNAQLQAATAARVSALLVDMFRSADPDATRGATITAREVLAQGARRMESDFADQPELQARMLGEIAHVYQNLGLYDEGARLATQSAGIWRSRGNTQELARATDQLGELDRARAQFVAAESRFREALALQRALHSGPHAEVAAVTAHLADALSGQRRHEEAEPLYRAALQMLQQLESDPHERATVLYALAASLHERGKFDEAEPLFRQALAIYRTVPGQTPDPRAAIALLNLSNVLIFREQYDEAEPLVREALAMRRTIYGTDHPAISEALTALGTLLYNKSAVMEAEPVLREAVAMEGRVLGAGHANTLPTRLILATTLAGLSRPQQQAEAGQQFRAVIAGTQTSEGKDSPLTVYARIHLAESDIAAGALGRARESFTQALAASRTLGQAHPYGALALRGLAEVDLRNGRFAQAETQLRRALASLPATMRPDHRYVLALQRTLAEALSGQKKQQAADSLFRGVLEVQRRRLPGAHVELARTLHEYGLLRLSSNDARGAEPLLREALAIRRDRLGPQHWQATESESALGECLALLDRQEEGKVLLVRGHDALRARFGNADGRTRSALERLNRFSF